MKYFLDHFFLAELNYTKELGFLKNKPYTCLQNKALENNQPISIPYRRNKHPEKFIFTGNLSFNSGVLKAIRLFESLLDQYPNASMQIIGHAPDKGFHQMLQARVAKIKQIELVGSEYPIGYDRIKEVILAGDVGFVTYQINPSNESCIPTKVFEYLAYQLPFICQENSTWDVYANELGMSFSSDFNDLSFQSIVRWYEKINFFYDNKPFLWESEEEKLLNTIDQVFN